MPVSPDDIRVTVQPGRSAYDHVLEEITRIREKSFAPITICWPTHTTALFMRRRLMRDTGGTFAIRNTTAVDVLSSLMTTSSFSYGGVKNIDDYARIASIARVVLPYGSPWRKIDVIDRTLRILSHVSTETIDRISLDFPRAYECYSLYNDSIDNNASHIINEELTSMWGRCIIVDDSSSPSQQLLERFPDFVESIIAPAAVPIASGTIPTSLFANPTDEIFHTLSSLSDLDPDITLDSCAIIVPSASYKRMVFSLAQSFSIPLSGFSPSDLTEHEFLCASISILDTRIRERPDFIDNFLDRFFWLRRAPRRVIASALIRTLNQLTTAQTVSEHIVPIKEFIAEFFDADHFSQSESDTSLAQLAFSLLIECSECHESATKDDCIFILDKRSRILHHEHVLGEGVYVATPGELSQSYFSHAYVLGMNDTYISPEPTPLTLITREAYPLYQIPENNPIEQGAHELSWLLHCADNLHVSTSRVDISGKDLISAPVSDISPVTFTGYPTAQRTVFSPREMSIEPSADFTAHLPITLSATSIETLAECPKKFFYQHVLGLSSEFVADNIDLLDRARHGTLVHSLLERYVRDSWTKSELFEHLHEDLESEYERGHLPHRSSITMNERIIAIELNAFLTTFEERTPSYYSTEIPIERELPSVPPVTLRGKIDRIDHYSDGHVRLIDYKTGDHKEKKSDNFFHYGRRLQLGIYAALLDETVTGIEYWYLKEKNVVSSHELTDDDRATLTSYISDIISIFTTGLLPARPTTIKNTQGKTSERDSCTSCSFTSICYDSAREQWAGFREDPRLASYVKATES